MQYLSKAYNYYSGINPATLSGAIDVIVVRHVDKDGNETLSSSPFHVRFGKLQVLRAGEKRVTLKLPNNLPGPHIAPFSMKVVDTGEAFFVFETDEDVPADMLTSPVVGPTEGDMEDGAGLSESMVEAESGGGPSTPLEEKGMLTLQPFGDTERQEIQKQDTLDADVLDLNHPANTLKEKIIAGLPHPPSTPASLLHVLPSIPFISPKASPEKDQPKASGSSDHAPPSPSHRSNRPAADEFSRPADVPNPIEATGNENTDLPHTDKKLSEVHEQDLPSVQPGAADGPEVVYGKGVVLDMAGYHSRSKNRSSALSGSSSPSEESLTATLVATLTEDLNTSAKILTERTRPPLPHHSASEPPLYDDDELDAKSEPDLSRLSLRDDRSVRATSEPPETPPRMSAMSSRPHSPTTLSRAPNGTVFPSMMPQSAVMDLAWDFGGRGKRSSIPPQPNREGEIGSPPLLAERTRSESMPITQHKPAGRLKNVEESPFLFVLEMGSGRAHTFELSLCGVESFSPNGEAGESEDKTFLEKRITFQQFIENPALVDDPALVLRYSLLYLSWTTGYNLLLALSMYRRALTPPTTITPHPQTPAQSDASAAIPARSSGYGWSRWWRRGESAVSSSQPPPAPPQVEQYDDDDDDDNESDSTKTTSQPVSTAISPSTTAIAASDTPAVPAEPTKTFAKTLRLSSDQLKQLKLHPGPNTVQFSVTSSYSGEAMCSSRIFLWESTDQIVISDIDGTITKSDALGHLYAAIGRDWTHLGIAKLYTDIANNGYRLLYLTSRAIGQADSTREYLRSIHQGEYRMPEGPVIMSPDRLMASLHREVIMRKPELFKMACLRDIQRLFATEAKEAFFAGFGNRITDAMSYRSVGIETSKIYTIDSTGVVKTELLQSAGHKGSYILLNDLVNEVFPPVSKSVKPEYTDFTYWRTEIADFPLPDLSPPSPALSARSDSSMSVLSKIIGRRASKQPILPTSHDPSSRPTSPLMGPAITSSASELDEEEYYNNPSRSHSRHSSMPGSYEAEPGSHFPQDRFGGRTSGGEDGDDDDDDVEAQRRRRRGANGDGGDDGEGDDEGGDDSVNYDDDDTIFDDDILAAGEMRNVPF